MCAGVVVEDIDEFNRLSIMMTALKPVDDQRGIAMQGIGLFNKVKDVNPVGQTDWNTGQLTAEDGDER